MKAALFCTCGYQGPAPRGVWPAPGDEYSAELAEASMATTLAQFKLADEVGFDWVTVAEHHYSPMSLTPNPLVMAGAITQVVKRAKIAVMGPDIPILNPLRVAEEFAMLDTLTGGRVVAGLFRGTANEYVTYNINPSESRERFEEALQLIKRAWVEEQPFGWQGRFYEYRTISLWPKPVQKPHPPIFMSGSSPESGTFAARNRIGLGLAFTPLSMALEAAAHYRAEAEKFGWEPTPDEVLYRVAVHVADTDDQAMEDALSLNDGKPRKGISKANQDVEGAAADAGYFGKDKNNQRARLNDRDLQKSLETGQLILGSPETVLGKIREIQGQLGAGIMDLTLGMQMGEKTMHAIELMGEKVLPGMREL
ncbi:MAG: LLM class flavin-dependent oxidoreductase [Rhodospirillales bacterium]|jgi:alkanesulfonate monooxygenase SsuD/methylene tetrahydromethanopterin reductase-like flavin-dependent oxidoreductase (luciferase family)|nr:LLM class flavin-dependent oxidoreductase [Rhodospirillales bacterium]